jgi:hypothetical protein
VRARLLAWAVRLLRRTWRVEIVGAEDRDAARRDGPAVYAFFHGDLLMLLAARPEPELAALVSRSRDGELAAGVLARLGLSPVRGSSSRDGRRGLRELLRRVRRGSAAVIAADGPRGPRHSVKPGVLLLASRSGRPLVPVAAAAWPALALRTWDGFTIPLPFARLVAVFGAPLRDASPRDQASVSALTEALGACRRRARERLARRG